MAEEFEAIASVLEHESLQLQAVTDEYDTLTDPEARERNRQLHDEHVQRFQRVNALLAQLIAERL